MNIDVREFLRINPISSYDITTSSVDDDCFLVFSEGSSDGYEVYTQKSLYRQIAKSILCNLVKEDDRGNIKLAYESIDDDGTVNWNDSIELVDTQFTSYVRYERFLSDMESLFAQADSLESEIDQKILSLRNNAILGYNGAVELMASASSLYASFKYSVGQIWCHGEGQTTSQGADRQAIGTIIQHTHAETSAETFSESLSSSRGGGSLVGVFKSGSRQMVASGSRSGEGTLQTSYDGLGPLSGKNILDWRNPSREHNNVPPSYNIYVRYCTTSRDSNVSFQQVSPLLARTSAVTPVHVSSTVPDLDEYDSSDQTKSDLLLRMIMVDGEVQLNKQTIGTVIGLLSDKMNAELSERTDDGDEMSMGEILEFALDDRLVPIGDFVEKEVEFNEKMTSISEKIETLKELLQSVKPRTYTGRIVISMTDDTEEKVISNYGGKQWIRRTNFMRGVASGSSDLGVRHGEEYVCLRESNIPDHTHDELFSEPEAGDGFEHTTGTKKVLAANSSGTETMILNQDGTTVNGMVEANPQYQISPLEYINSGSDSRVIEPHNNMPPYRQVYIWECVVGDE